MLDTRAKENTQNCKVQTCKVTLLQNDQSPKGLPFLILKNLNYEYMDDSEDCPVHNLWKILLSIYCAMFLAMSPFYKGTVGAYGASNS